MKLLVILVIVLAIIAIVQLTKVYEFSRALRKTKEEDISPADNKMNANLMLWWMILFFIGTIICFARYGDYLPEPASEHGKDVDWLMSVNMWMITVMFYIMNAMLFLVSWKYYYRKDRKAKFISHDNRLEMIWTLIPGVAMAFIIVFGLITWNKITGPASPDAMLVELYSKQFDWTARYQGDNGTFGASSFNLIATDNPMGLVTKDKIQAQLDSLDSWIAAQEEEIKNDTLHLMPASWVEAKEDKIYRWQRHKQRILDLTETKTASGLSDWEAGSDDKIVKGEMHLPLGREVEFIFRSQDVIHSAYMPHFRAQMNTVPGVPTRFKMTPTITTKEMKQKLGDEDFDYILLCNKVCGVSHFNMQMKVIVETPEEFDAWLKAQKTFVAQEKPIEKNENDIAPTDTSKVIAQPAPTSMVR